MSKIFQCSYCDKTFANRHNLSRHRKAFHAKSILADRSRDKGNGLIMDYSSGYKSNDHHKSERQMDTDTIDEDVTDSETESEDHNVDDDDDDKDEEEENDDHGDGDDASSSEVNHPKGYLLWETLARTCFNNESEALPTLMGSILLYIKSQSDTLFNTIMRDVMNAKSRRVSVEDAITYAIDKNKESIIASVNGCKGNADMIWCHLARQSDRRDCPWFIGKCCSCRRCTRIIKAVIGFILVVIGMLENDIVQKIVADVGDVRDTEELNALIFEAVERYRDDILTEFRDAKKVVEARG